MDVEPAPRFLNAYATHCVWRWERPIEMTFCFEPGPTELFFSAQNKAGLSSRRLCPAENTFWGSLLAACKTLARKQPKVPKSSTTSAFGFSLDLSSNECAPYCYNSIF